MKIAVIGLGYVGLPLALSLSHHYDVVGFDIKKDRVDGLRNGEDLNLEFSETEIRSSRSLFTTSIEEIKDCNVFIVTVPTPVRASKEPDLTPLIESSEMLSRILKNGDIVVYESTVYPGATEEVCIPILSKGSGLTLGENFSVGYSPERVSPADKQHSVHNTKKIISASDERTLEILNEVYSKVVSAGVYLAPSIKVSEAAKILENIQRDVNIALINECSTIFNLMNIDTSEVLDAASSKWNFVPFQPGLVGGHCIGVDPYYLIHKSASLGFTPKLMIESRSVNESVPDRLVYTVLNHLQSNFISLKDSRIGLLGLTFKENCPDVRNSKSLELEEKLKNLTPSVFSSDPFVNTSVQLKDLDVLIVAVAHEEYLSYSPEYLRSLMRGNTPLLVDVKSIYSRSALENLDFNVFRL